jgi:hypothetical protein
MPEVCWIAHALNLPEETRRRFTVCTSAISAPSSALRHMSGNETTAEEVTQEVFLQLFWLTAVRLPLNGSRYYGGLSSLL